MGFLRGMLSRRRRTPFRPGGIDAGAHAAADSWHTPLQTESLSGATRPPEIGRFQVQQRGPQRRGRDYNGYCVRWSKATNLAVLFRTIHQKACSVESTSRGNASRESHRPRELRIPRLGLSEDIVVGLFLVLLGVVGLTLLLHLLARLFRVPVASRLFGEMPWLPAEWSGPLAGGECVRFPAQDGVWLQGTYLPTTAARRRGVIAFCHELNGDRWSATALHCRSSPPRLRYLHLRFPQPRLQRSRGGLRAHALGDDQRIARRRRRDRLPLLARRRRSRRHRPDGHQPRRHRGAVRGGTGSARAGSGRRRCGAYGTVATLPRPQHVATLLRPLRLPAIVPEAVLRTPCAWVKRFVGWHGHCPLLDIDEVARRVQQPVLLIHGRHDAHVPLEAVLSLRSLMSRPARLWIVPHAQHNRAISTAPDEYRRRVARFFCRTLGTAMQVDAAHPATPRVNGARGSGLANSAPPADVHPRLTEPVAAR